MATKKKATRKKAAAKPLRKEPVNLLSFLAELTEDKQKLNAFRSDPEKAMTKAGLKASDQKILLSGDPREIRKAMGFEPFAVAIVVLIFKK